jgi:hypothetical protein
MIFRKILTCQASMGSGLKYTTFKLSAEEIMEAHKRTHKNPLLLLRDCGIVAVYSDNNEIRLDFYISYYGFKEGIGKHEIKRRTNDWIICECNKVFNKSKRITADERFEEHKRKMQKVESELMGRDTGEKT